MSINDISIASIGLTSVKESTQEKPVIFKVFMAVVGILSASSIVPFLGVYEGVGTWTRALWRAQLIVLFATPLCTFSIKNKNDFDSKAAFNAQTFKKILLAVMIYIASAYFYIKSSYYTLVSHTILLGNTGGILMIAVSLLTCKAVHRLEILSAIFVLIFGVVLASDNASTKLSPGTNILLGDIFALISMPLFAGFIYLNSKIIKKMPSMMLLAIINVFQILACTFATLHLNAYDWSLTFSKDEKYGVFGWMSSKYILFSLTLMGPVTGILGTGSYIYLLNYFPPHIVASIFLLEPMCGQILGCILGLDNLPGAITYIGALGILAGLGLGIRGDQLKRTQENKVKYEVEMAEDRLI